MAQAFPTAAGVYAAASSSGTMKTTKLLQTVTEDYMPSMRFGVLNQTPLLKAFGVKAFGKDLLNTGAAQYGNVTGNRGAGGKAIKLTDPSFQFSGPILLDYASPTHVGQMGNINPEYMDSQDAWSYPYRRLVASIYIPEEVVKDNKGKNKLQDIMERDLAQAQAGMTYALVNVLTGNTSAPTNNPYGLNYLVSVTQSITVGGILGTSNTYWNNVRNACTSVGGGGEVDRPIQLLRSMERTDLDIMSLPGSDPASTMLVATRGAYQYYHRAGYADTVAQGLRNADMYDAKVDHLVFGGKPVIYDPAVTTPYGASATTTECIYWLNTAELGLAIRRDEFLDVEPWEAPRTHDKQRYFQSNIWLRYTPFVSHRRVQGVLYNLPQNPDAA